MHVALVTASAGFEGPSGDEEILGDELERRGVAADIVSWDDVEAGWDRYDLVVVRSTWDYERRRSEFLAWADGIGDRLRNPPQVIRWNTDKRYLAELAAGGIAVVPLMIVEPGDGQVLPTAWTDVVVKPVVGHSAIGLIRTSDHTAARSHIDDLGGPGLVQPYQPAVEAGELSIVHFAGAYSHTVLKTPPPGEFRAQGHLGATSVTVEPSTAELELAETALAASPGGPFLYSRVDIVTDGDDPVLMEVELTEPSLFLGLMPPALGRFAAAIVAELG